jgi:hypothetical protein
MIRWYLSSQIKLVDTPIYPEMKLEYVKIVQIKKLKMKLTFSLDVQNLVGREMIFSIPYQLKLKIAQFTNGFSIFIFFH